MSRLLGNPLVDPHGDPIPTPEGGVHQADYTSLATMQVGTSGSVRRVPDSDPALLRYLESLGLLPGAQVELRAREPFLGPITVVVGDDERMLGHELASRVLIEANA